ncbi:MEMO1 family protein [Mytilus galloprovincialis]|uniref:MEMO1 family protein n=1 Tax=Mytilus galloprovincialis TaxID=29158 RepID=A0A8B6GZW0_MYTGA|nr:MEMO1 family protein [Mytilus galloprovincialis]
MSKVRRATHAGSWYTDDGAELSSQLSGWLAPAKPIQSPARAIIAPHAGYSYCGACGGHAYKQIDPTHIKKIPHLEETKLPRIPICTLASSSFSNGLKFSPAVSGAVKAYRERNLFQFKNWNHMQTSTNLSHGVSLHLLFKDVRQMLNWRQGHFTIIPVLVGSLSVEKEELYGRIFANYLADPENLFVISSDFCHWGQRFHYTYHDQSCGQIWQSIEALDKMGMDIIESLNPAQFTDYLKQYHNTICGRYPIGVLLNAVHTITKNGNGHKMSFKFVKYAQSSQCKSMRDSSVSYASGALVIE